MGIARRCPIRAGIEDSRLKLSQDDPSALHLEAEALVPTHGRILSLAWPIILANATVPLLGLADTAVIGRNGNATELASIALGALIFNFLYWGCGFLRMGTTGLTAQAAGERNEAEVRATLMRALCVGAAIGFIAILGQQGIIEFSLALLSAEDNAEQIASQYIGLRIWGVPASLCIFAVMGAFIGLGRSDLLLKVQLFLNGLNIVLDVLFAGVFGWGVAGIAIGTAVAEWCALGLAVFLAMRLFRARHSDQSVFFEWSRVMDREQLLRSVSVNRDILLRTLFLLFGFAWFTNEAAQFGNIMLAANHVLLQFITFSAYVLDGYANATEPLVGRALGARSRKLFDVAVRRSMDLAAVSAIVLALGILVFGPAAIGMLTDIAPVRKVALEFLPYGAAYILCAFAAYQFDGIFIGATQTRDMRNASLLSLLCFMAAWWWLTPRWGNHGLWIAMIIYVIARAGALMIYFPKLRARLPLR